MSTPVTVMRHLNATVTIKLTMDDLYIRPFDPENPHLHCRTPDVPPSPGAMRADDIAKVIHAAFKVKPTRIEVTRIGLNVDVLLPDDDTPSLKAFIEKTREEICNAAGLRS